MFTSTMPQNNTPQNGSTKNGTVRKARMLGAIRNRLYLCIRKVKQINLLSYGTDREVCDLANAIKLV